MKMNTMILMLGLRVATAPEAWAASRGSKSDDTVIVMAHGQVITGRVRAVQESRYIVQGTGENGETLFYDVPGDQIATVDGSEELPDFDHRDRVATRSQFEQVMADGGAVTWVNVSGLNGRGRLLTKVSWGVADWEVERTKNMRVVDAYGNVLPHELRMKKKRRIVEVKLAVPVAPGENYEFNVAYSDPGRVTREGDVWTYSFAGDFSEDTFLMRKVLLPRGAELVDASPFGVKGYDHDGAPLVFWKRFLFAGETGPFTVRYRLP